MTSNWTCLSWWARTVPYDPNSSRCTAIDGRVEMRTKKAGSGGYQSWGSGRGERIWTRPPGPEQAAETLSYWSVWPCSAPSKRRLAGIRKQLDSNRTHLLPAPYGANHSSSARFMMYVPMASSRRARGLPGVVAAQQSCIAVWTNTFSNRSAAGL